MKIGSMTGTIIGAGALVLALTACGSNAPSNTPSGPTVTGMVDSRAVTTVTLEDSSAPSIQKSVTTDPSGRYVVDVTGLTPPYLLKAAMSSGGAEYSLATQPGTADIDSVTSTVVALASTNGNVATEWSSADVTGIAGNFDDAMTNLQDTLAVLFQHYGVTLSEGHQSSAPFQTMLSQVEFLFDGDVMMVRNRTDGTAIFESPMSDLSSGEFHAENLPGGVTFEKDVDPIFTRAFKTVEDPGTCFSCHSKGLPTSDDVPFVWTSPADPVADYKTIVATGLVNPADPTSSLLYTKPTGQVDHGGDQVFPPTSPEAQAILTWIKAGALAASVPGLAPSPIVTPPSPTPTPGANPVAAADVVASCTACHGLTSNTTVFKSGGYTVTGRTSTQWLTTVSSMVGLGAQLAPGTTAQNYADYLAGVP